MWAIQYKSSEGWRICIRDLTSSTLEVFLLKEEAEKEFKKQYKPGRAYAFEMRLVEIQVDVREVLK